MTLSIYELAVLSASILAIFLLGTTYIRTNLGFYSAQTMAIAAATMLAGSQREPHLYVIALIILLLKAVGIPVFLIWIADRIDAQTDAGTYLPAPLSMHLGILLLGASYILSSELPMMLGHGQGSSRIGATAAMSLLFSGILVMLTRRIAISQIIGFLMIENGIYLFALTQTHGMPMMVEMGILLDVLVGVMIAGLLLFRIKKSFEHIDASQLTQLKD